MRHHSPRAMIIATVTAADKRRLLSKFEGNQPAGASAIAHFETESGFHLPRDYSEFLEQINGGEGFVGNTYVILWRIEELLEMNRAYQASDYAPGLFLFGSDGGGEAFAFDMRSDAKSVVSVPFVGMDLKLARPLALNFNAFLEELLKS